MKLKLSLFSSFILVLLVAGVIKAQSNLQWFGGTEDVDFARDLWVVMEQAALAGDTAEDGKPYHGLHPHGAILETALEMITVNGVTGTVVVKRSYRGFNISIAAVEADRATFLDDITVMFQREDGYDELNQNWFWAKYNTDGTLDATPNGVELAGRIAKGKGKGCIACHRKAGGGDFLHIN